MKVLVVGDPHGKLPKRIPKKIDLILVTGDLGKADIARNRFFENMERTKKGLPELEKDDLFEKKVWQEIYKSSISIAKTLSKLGPVYTVLGNVGTATDYETKIEEKKLGIKLPYIRSGLKRIKNFHVVRNRVQRINRIRFGFLEHFIDPCWFKEFNQKNEKRLKRARVESAKAKRVLKWFDEVDVLVSHQPPYGVLDKISGAYGAPKSWWGKHAGSKIVLDYIKKKQPRYVFCGHIHEGKGMKKIGKSEVYNVGVSGDYVLLDID